MDGLTETTMELIVTPWLFWLITALSVIGVLMALGFLAFNIRNREVR